MIFLLIIIAIILWFSGTIPKQIGKLYAIQYMNDNFSKMELKFVNIEWNKKFDSYTIQFKDKNEEIYGVVIGPKYFPINLGQGLFTIEEIYKENYLETSNNKINNNNIENNLVKIENNIITNEQYIDEFISNVKTSSKELCLIIEETKTNNVQTIIFKYIPGEKTINEIDTNTISNIYTSAETSAIAMEELSKKYGYYELTVKSDNEDFIKKFDAYNYELVKNNVDNIIKVELQTDLDVNEYLILCQYNNEIELYGNSTKILSQSYGIDYYIENDIFYTDKDNLKILSAYDAANIAEKEAQKDKYQYQSWKSDFYARGKDKNEILSATLLDGTKTVDIKEDWKNANYNNETLIWEIRLFDDNDPLTSLFVYVNAIDGTIIGAQELSD